jgi:hypothetical protein
MLILEWTQVMPWVTGGLAGSVLTYGLNQRAARKKQARLVAETGSIALSPSKSIGTSSPGLMVSYNGKVYEDLFRFEVSVVNVSGRTSTTTPFLFTFAPNTQVAGVETVVTPLDRVTSWEIPGGANNAYLWNLGELKPSDRAKLVVFHTSREEPGVAFRGDDDVDVTIDSRASRRSIEYALTVTGVWVAMYVLAGAIPEFGAVVRGFLVFSFIPFAVRWGSRFFSVKPAMNSQVIEIETVHAETVSFVSQ